MACRSSLLGFGMPRTGSSSAILSSATFLGHLDFRCMSSAMFLLGAGLRPQCKVSRGHKFSDPTTNNYEIFIILYSN